MTQPVGEVLKSGSELAQIVDNVRQGRPADSVGDVFPGHDARINDVAIFAGKIIDEAVGTALSESATYPHGFDLEDKADQDEFLLSIKAALALAILDLDEQAPDFFDALNGAELVKGDVVDTDRKK